MIKGLIFDFDGTLANTLPVIFASFDYATEKVFGHTVDRAPFIETFGQPLQPSLIRLYGEETGERICRIYRDFQEVHHDELIRPFPGVKETLAALKAQELPLMIVTSKFSATCLRGIRCLGLEPYIDGIIGADAVTKPKPDPEPSRKALERLGLPGEQVLIVGDTPYDLLSGKGAGCHTAAVEYTEFGKEKFLQQIIPEHWLPDMPALLPLLKTLNE